MKHFIYAWVLISLIACTNSGKAPEKKETIGEERYRPLIHFTPATAWMNDPNGMVFYNGTYHLFYQYYPDSTVWGPVHWGHATTKDLVHWEHQPIALYPDSLGYIFSGSAVVDSLNTSGFGKDGKVPLVAIFTHHNMAGEKAGTDTFQYQSLAYSLDEGVTWTKYHHNPVLKNPGIRDFRDPKVMWYDAGKKWIMTLATKDRITFYSSSDLKAWKKESEFGATIGAHGGVWECPDLFPLEYNGKAIWVLTISINPGGPNGGSATQYFVGDFNGNRFTPYQTDTRWIDYGPDDYAGVTWSNTGKRKIFLGWMSNWQYATLVPTQKWRSAMTVPRELSLEKVGDKFLLRSAPVSELSAISDAPEQIENASGNYQLYIKPGEVLGARQLKLKGDWLSDFSVSFSNAAGQKVVAGYDRKSNRYYIDRTTSGKTDFEKGFAARHWAPRLSAKPYFDATLIIDEASLELFADSSLTVMTSIFFPSQPFSTISIQSPNDFVLKELQYAKLNSIYQTPK